MTHASPLRRALIGASLAVAAAAAQAAPITSVAGLTGTTTTIDFSAYTGGSQITSGNGPVVIGAGVTLTDPTGGGNIWLYNGSWGLGSHGTWNASRNGYLGIYDKAGPLRITFDTAISGFGFFTNYAEGFGDTLSAYDAGGNLLETFAIETDAPITTSAFSQNDGAFRGIQLGSASIAYIELTGFVAVFDDLTYTTAAINRVPEANALALVGLALLSLGLARRARKSV